MSSTADVLRSLVAVPSIADLLAHPERAADLPADVARALLAQVAPLQMALLGRAFANGRALRFSEVGIEAWIRRQQRR